MSTPTPRALSTSAMVLAICAVSFSWERAVARERDEIADVLPVEPCCAFFIRHGSIIEDRRTDGHGLDELG